MEDRSVNLNRSGNTSKQTASGCPGQVTPTDPACPATRPALQFVLLLSLLILMCAGIVSQARAQQTKGDHRQLLQLAEYIGVDYIEAVADGEIINDGEYREMLDFSTVIISQTENNSPEQVRNLAVQLQEAIVNKQSPDSIRHLTTQLRVLILAESPQLSLPGQLLARAETQELFTSMCASCHGARGKGDGPAAAALDPPPTNFTDHDRASNRSLIGLHDAIDRGLEGTAMQSYAHLSDIERWSLAFYVGGLAAHDSFSEPRLPPSISVDQLISMSPAVLANQYPGSSDAIWQLRAHPQNLFNQVESPLATARNQMTRALAAYQQEKYDDALQLTVSAYLDGFELVESVLDTRDVDLRKGIEASMLDLRGQIRRHRPATEIELSINNILGQLDEADAVLNSDTLSSTALFSASFLILLREGLEALLVILALLTVLKRTRRDDATKYVHAGWAFALAAGLVTWWAAQELIVISGASREIMEGVAALLAAVVLFYVGFWMHNKSQAKQWQAYINKHVDKHLSNGTLWGIALLAFVAVYREVFETVLFYQALITQTSSGSAVPVVVGFATAFLGLGVVAWLMSRYSVKMPIGKFFGITTWLMLGLSFALLGKAVAALQEASIMNISRLPFDFVISWLGIYPTWEGIIAQLLLVGIGGVLLFWNASRAKVSLAA